MAAIGTYVTPQVDGRMIVVAMLDDWGFQKRLILGGLEYLGRVVRHVMPRFTDIYLDELSLQHMEVSEIPTGAHRLYRLSSNNRSALRPYHWI